MTSKEVDKRLEDIYRFNWERIRRNPNFIKAVQCFWKSFKKNPIKILDLEEKFIEKWKISPPPENYLNDSKRWAIIDFYDIVAVIPDRPWYKAVSGETLEIKKQNWQDLLKKDRAEFYKHILKNNRFLTLRVDTNRNKTLIMRAISKKLDWIINSKRQFRMGEFLDRTLNLKKMDRYFAVFDLRNQKPPIEYQNIVSQLNKYYKKKDTVKAVNLARQDFQVAFEAIYGIRYKEYDKSKFKKSDFKSCLKCPKLNICTSLCAEAEYAVAQVEVKRKEKLFDKGVTDII